MTCLFRRAAVLGAAIALGTVGSACSDDAASCVSFEPCDPLYEPNFDNLFTRTLQPKCGVEGGACHSSEGAQGGLRFADVDESYQLLVDEGRVLPEDPGCGVLLRRTEASGAEVMPPGAPMSEAERCVLRSWVEAGAPR